VLILLERLNSEFKKTIIIVTHDPKAAARARRLVRLEKGILKEDIPTEGLGSARFAEAASVFVEARPK